MLKIKLSVNLINFYCGTQNDILSEQSLRHRSPLRQTEDSINIVKVLNFSHRNERFCIEEDALPWIPIGRSSS